MTGDGVDVVSDSLGGPISLRSFRVLRPGGRVVVFGRYDTLKDGHNDWPAVFKWYGSIVAVFLLGALSPRRKVMKYQIQEFRGGRLRHSKHVIAVCSPRALAGAAAPRAPDTCSTGAPTWKTSATGGPSNLMGLPTRGPPATQAVPGSTQCSDLIGGDCSAEAFEVEVAEGRRFD
jgi:hypothetical protein